MALSKKKFMHGLILHILRGTFSIKISYKIRNIIVMSFRLSCNHIILMHMDAREVKEKALYLWEEHKVMVLNLIMFVRLCVLHKKWQIERQKIWCWGPKVCSFFEVKIQLRFSIFCWIIRLSCFKTSWHREFSKRSFCSLHL